MVHIRKCQHFGETEADFGNHFSTLIFGHIVMAFFLTLLCARFVPGGGPGACATIAILVALIYAGAYLITFAVQPLTTKILCGWIVGDLIQSLGCRRNHRHDLQVQLTGSKSDSKFMSYRALHFLPHLSSSSCGDGFITARC